MSGAPPPSGGTAGLGSGPGRQVHSPTLVTSTDSLITAAPRPLHPPSSDTLPSTSRGPVGWIVGGVVALAVVGIGLQLLWPSFRGDGASTSSEAVTAPVTPAPPPSLPAGSSSAGPSMTASTSVAPPPVEPPPAEPPAAADPRAPEQGTGKGAEKKLAVKVNTSGPGALASASSSGSGSGAASTTVTTTAPEAATSTVRGVKFVVEAATAVSASCGAISGSGSTSAYLRDVPVGACTVRATIDGVTRTAAVSIDRPGGLTCALQGDQLQCQ